MLFIPVQVDDSDTFNYLAQFYSAIHAYYFTFMILFAIAGTGLAIQVWRAYNVNYTFLFEIDQYYKLIHH